MAKLKILYVCTHNRCRSILSEAITNKIAGDIIEVRSAGSNPAASVHPLTIKYLQQTGYPTQDLKSQSWNDFAEFQPDLVITVCDSAAGEACPLYFGSCLKIHWGLSDPSKVEGDAVEQERAFLNCIEKIALRAEKLRHIASQELDKNSLQAALLAVGKI